MNIELSRLVTFIVTDKFDSIFLLRETTLNLNFLN